MTDSNAVKKKPLLDPSSWVDDHGDALFKFAVLHLGDANLAEEMVQDTFVSALSAKDTFKGLSSERSWLISILKHKIIDYIRKASRQRKVYDENMEESDFDRQFDEIGHWAEEYTPMRWKLDPHGAVEQKAFFKALEHCLVALPERMKKAFTLRELDELDSEDICSTLEITSANLWVLLHRARLRLRKCLELNWFHREERNEG